MKANSGKSKPVVLIVDDQYKTFSSLPRSIAPEEFTPVWVPDEEHGLELLNEHPGRDWIIIIDLKSSGMGGGGFLHRARKMAPRAAFLVTGPLGPFLYKGGMFYEFAWPTLKQQINTILRGICRNGGAGTRQGALAATSGCRANREQFGLIIGRSESMNAVYNLIQNIKDSNATVLIQGESGTGKELIARTIHQTSPRSHRPFVAINCGAIPAPLVESELFGHERGAFTGALYLKKGKFEIADGGTLFLDEIGELDKDLQVRLLRVLQEREFQRVGGNITVKVDVRVIAATSQDLRSRLQEGEFREDLYYRLHVVPIHAPPLRERKEDIPLLLEHFYRKVADAAKRPLPVLAPETHEALARYSYPGNVRELANIMERLLVTCQQAQIRPEDLPVEVLDEVADAPVSPDRLKELPDEGVALREIERELILKTLRKTSGNKAAAAKMLQITRRFLYLRLAEYGLK